MLFNTFQTAAAVLALFSAQLLVISGVVGMVVSIPFFVPLVITTAIVYAASCVVFFVSFVIGCVKCEHEQEEDPPYFLLEDSAITSSEVVSEEVAEMETSL